MSAVNFLIAIVPLLLLVAALCFGRYPGEVAIERIRTLLDTATASPLRVLPRREGFQIFQFAVRGGRLIACSLAGRAPPAPARI